MTPTTAGSGGQDRIPTTAAGRAAVEACFAAGWTTVGVILGVVGGWWALLAGPVILALTVAGAMRYREVRRG